jgi:hypothetical protein
MSDAQPATDVEALIKAQFSGNADAARALLLKYTGPESDRVRRGILTLSKGRLALLEHNVNQALGDYRDILYWAEYPEQSQR